MVLALLGTGGCSSGEHGGERDGLPMLPAPNAGNFDGSDAPEFGQNGNFGSGGATATDAPLPAEREVALDFERPQASERFVYAVNPAGGTVSIIDAETLAIQTLETGEEPTYLQTLAGSDDAIVLNLGSDDATIMRDPGGALSTATVPVVDGANSIAVAPDGKHAVAYFDSERSSAAHRSGSFQDVTVIRLEKGADTAVDMTVGFRPRGVFFAADSSTAYVVTEDGVSVLNFETVEASGTGIAKLVSLGEDVDQQSLDVSVTLDGRFALTREPGAGVIRLVDLENGEIQNLDLGEHIPAAAFEALGIDVDTDADAGVALPTVAVTDLDLAPSGDFALAVLRDFSTVLRIPVPGAFEDASSISAHVIAGELVGSATIAPNGDRALLYTTAVPLEKVTILPLTGDAEPQTVAIRKAVEAVAIAPDGETALILHTKADGDPKEPGIDPDAQIDRSHGYSVLHLLGGDVKLQVTPVRPGAFALVPDGSHLFVLLRDDLTALRSVHMVETRSFLVENIALGSPPVSVGSVPARKRVFVGQEHGDGRITFIDWESGERETVTGFELNSRIRD